MNLQEYYEHWTKYVEEAYNIANKFDGKHMATETIRETFNTQLLGLQLAYKKRGYCFALIRVKFSGLSKEYFELTVYPRES